MASNTLSLGRRAALTVAALLVAAGNASAQQAVTVVEYYNKATALYFLTGRATEQALLDAQPDFQRTGMTFAAVDASGTVNAPLDRVCRYRIAVPNSRFSTHFYGPTADCNSLAAANLSYFFNEGFDFAIEKPNAAGACPANAPVAVYRSFRKLTPVDVSNHRYTVSAASYAEMARRGWASEGAVFCATSATQETPRPTFASSSQSKNLCEAPRVGTSPFTGVRYPDNPGTLADEKQWLRSWTDETYLWYREVATPNAAAYTNAASYFTALKTNGVTANGAAKDRFHFSERTADVEAEQAGTSASYGIQWSLVRNLPPRELRVAVVEFGSPADQAGVKRGATVVSIDGESLVNGNNVSVLNNGIYPANAGESHTFVFRDDGATETRSVTLVSQNRDIQPVPRSGYIQTTTGRVGYLLLTTFGAFPAESALVNAVNGLKALGVSDLVLDLRYNPGGYLDISGQLAYMIAGPARTTGKIYETTKFNDKLPYGIYGNSLADVQTPFHRTTLGFSLTAGNALPSLNLGRVYVLTSPTSCSASEAVINGLRGIGVEVILIGNTTCGKPYGFYVTDNCGTSYYSIQFTGVNDRGDGDYIDGFAPTCVANDDWSGGLGDPSEKQLAAALNYRNTGVCTPSSASASSKRSVLDDSAPGAVRATRTLGEGVKLARPAQLGQQPLRSIEASPPEFLGEQR